MFKRILSVAGFVGTAFVAAAVAVRFTRPEMTRVWYGLVIAGLVCLLAYVAGDWREFVRLFSRRRVQYGTNALLGSALVLGILVVLNYLSSGHNRRFDLTVAKLFSLSGQSQKMLAGLKEPVKIYVFDRDRNFDTFRDRLKEYEYGSKKLSVEYVDPDKKPSLAKKYAVQQYGTIVFELGNRTEKITSNTEQDITNGLIKLLKGGKKVIYFASGEGEKDTQASDRTGYSAVAKKLQDENFDVKKVVLLQENDVPVDCAVLIIAGPTKDSPAPEIDAIRRYLKKGGKAMFLIDPPDPRSGTPLTNLGAFLKEWNVTLGNDVVVDVSGAGRLIGADEFMPVVANYPYTAITDRFNLATLFPLARSVEPGKEARDGITAQPLMQTSDRSWAETDMEKEIKTGRVVLDDRDKKGPITLGAVVTASVADTKPAAQPASAKSDGSADKKTPQTRLVVIGDSDFATNAVAGFSGNQDFFLNSVNWLAQEEDFISVRTREPEDRRINMTAAQQRTMLFLSLFIIPGVVIATGVYVWWVRR